MAADERAFSSFEWRTRIGANDWCGRVPPFTRAGDQA